MSRIYPNLTKKKPEPELVICYECEQCIISDRKRKGQRDSWCMGYSKNITEKALMEERKCGKFEP